MRKVSSSANTIAAITSDRCGTSGFSWSGTRSAVIETTRSQATEDEGEGDSDDRQRLSHRESDPSRAHHRATGLGLPRRALDGRAEDQAHADSGADGGG